MPNGVRKKYVEFWEDFLPGMPERQAIHLLQELKINFHIGDVFIRNYDPYRMTFKIDRSTGRVQKGSVHFG